jgi:coenzyme F420-reducing hydrogenase alpha subunit
MTHKANGSRTLRVDELARVEGEGAMLVRTRDGRVETVELRIYEPPRFFEAFLRGRAYTEPPDITARICGICPVAYQMSACTAIEDACGATVDGPLADLRRLIYCGEWIESHALHVYLLHAPDFLGYDGAVEMAADHRDVVQRGLAMKKAGNEIIALLGGRPIHPVNVRVGGFYRVPARRELRPLAEQLRRGRDLALETVRWVAGFDFPGFEGDYELVAVRSPDGEYPIFGDGVASSGGLDIDVHDLGEQLVEHHVPHSTALHASLGGLERPYMCGPLARYGLAAAALSPLAREAAAEAGLGGVCRNPFQSIVVRAVEILYAFDEALRLIDRYEEPDAPAVPVEPRAATGHGVTEAPRGMLYHRYELDGDGIIRSARIVPPTSQNQRQIEDDLRRFVEPRLHLSTDELTRRCEQAIRNYDPCISCATHFLDLEVAEA